MQIARKIDKSVYLSDTSVSIKCTDKYSEGLQLLLNTKLRIEGILITLVDSRTNDAKEIEQLIRKTYQEQIPAFAQKIPISVKASESKSNGISVYSYDPKGIAAEGFKRE